MNSYHFPVRVYYEDTDHAGVVYYANYLKFMERGRTEMLREHGIAQDTVQRDHGVVFAVTEAHVRYLIPARFNDALDVETTLTLAKGARLSFQQRIWRNHHGAEQLLCDGTIHLACIDAHGKPSRIPHHLMALFQQQLPQPKSNSKEAS